jgi:hypothetical protein
MLINGVDIIFIAPVVLLVLLAITVGAWRLSTRGTKAAAVSVLRVLVYGSFALMILFFAWVALYYAGGGH